MWLCLVFLLADSFQDLRSGLIALNQNNLAVAQSKLEAASLEMPSDARVWMALAQTYWKLHQTGKAEAAADRAASLAKDAALLDSLGLFYAQSGSFDKAATSLRAAIESNRFEERYYFDLADLYLKRQQFSAALEALEPGRRIFSRSAQLELAAGVAYYGLRRFPEAIDAFLRTIGIDPTVEQPYVFLGRMLEQAEGRLPKIRGAFAAFVQRAPRSYLSNFEYAKLLALDSPAEAEPFLRKSIALDGRFPDSHFELGVLLDRQRHYPEAAREMEHAAELDPADPVPHYRLARLYDRLGEPAKAASERALHRKLSAAAAPR